MNGTPGKANTTRGDATRMALVTTAIRIFGRDGFNTASTRAISQAAGVNQALIGYHFGGKPGLYFAALRHIVDSINDRIGPLLERIEMDISPAHRAPGHEPDPQQALGLLHQITDALVQVLTSDESADWARLILREQQDPSEGFDLLYDGFMNRTFSLVARLVSLVLRKQDVDQESRLRAVTIVGQVLVFRAARTVIMRELGWDRLEPAEIETIKALLRHNVTAALATE